MLGWQMLTTSGAQWLIVERVSFGKTLHVVKELKGK
jgi:hypothetical protein